MCDVWAIVFIMAIKEKRILKVYKRRMKVSEKSTFYKNVPEIRLQGDWLRYWGFNPDCDLIVHCENEKIVITKK